jgi:hypothetical protein
MKKYIIFLILAMMSETLIAQRMVYKQKSVEVNTGMLNASDIGKNFYLNLTLNSFAKHGNYWIWAVEYQKTTEYKNWEIPMEDFWEIGYSVKLLSDSRKFITLNGGVTGVAGYEWSIKEQSAHGWRRTKKQKWICFRYRRETVIGDIPFRSNCIYVAGANQGAMGYRS